MQSSSEVLVLGVFLGVSSWRYSLAESHISFGNYNHCILPSLCWCCVLVYCVQAASRVSMIKSQAGLSQALVVQPRIGVCGQTTVPLARHAALKHRYAWLLDTHHRSNMRHAVHLPHTAPPCLPYTPCNLSRRCTATVTTHCPCIALECAAAAGALCQQ